MWIRLVMSVGCVNIGSIARLVSLLGCVGLYPEAPRSDRAEIEPELTASRAKRADPHPRVVINTMKLSDISMMIIIGDEDALPFDLAASELKTSSMLMMMEDTSHLFFSCDVALAISRLICRWWNVSWSPVDSYSGWLEWFNSIRLSSKLKGILEGVFYVSWWCLWNFRNQLLFASKKPRKETLFDDVVSRSFIWSNSRSAEWDKYIKFWNDPKNLARAAQNLLNRQKSVVTSRQGSRSLARLRDEMEEMKRLEATGEYTEDEINALARGGKLRGHIPGVGRVLPSRATSRPSMPAPDKSLKSMHRKVDFMMSLFRSDSKYSDMFKEFESGGASGSGGCGDDEESGDDEEGEDEDGDGESCGESIQVLVQNNDHACEKEGVVIDTLAFTYDEDRIDCMEVGIEGKGLCDVATRLFVMKLLMRRKLYVYALVDTDRDDLWVLCDSGSIIPDLKWLGIRPSDMDKYEIPEECRLPMTKEDLKAGRELNWKEKAKQKVELQAFGTFHFNYLTKFYLPRKL
ncbi:F-box domain containing protein [Tanacetum coccineum]